MCNGRSAYYSQHLLSHRIYAKQSFYKYYPKAYIEHIASIRISPCLFGKTQSFGKLFKSIEYHQWDEGYAHQEQIRLGLAEPLQEIDPDGR